MAIYDRFQNFNMDIFSSGMNTTANWYCQPFQGFGFNMPTFNLGGIFSSWFNQMPYGMPLVDFSKIFPTDNVWDKLNKPNSGNFSWNDNINDSIWNTTTKFTFNNGSKTKSGSAAGDTVTLTNKNKKGFSVSNYDAEAGERLAKTALKGSVGFTGKCATYVKQAIEKTGLGEYVYGDAYKVANILRNNKNFKEISPSSVDVKDLPAGCVIVYDKGVEGYSSTAGHTEITTGDGRAVSDGITNNLYKKPSSIFVPVKA